MKSKWIWMTIAVLTIGGSAYAQEEPPDESAPPEEAMATGNDNSVGIGGVVDVAHAEGNRNPSSNSNTLGDNNFNNIRALLTVQFSHKEKIRADVEVLFDDKAQDRVRLQGAFVTIFDVLTDKVNLMAGKIPNPYGNFAKREFSDVNPLIGQPLLRQYRTSLDWNNVWSNREQLILKDKRRQHHGNIPIGSLSGAAPMVYDARWDFGVELFGTIDWFEYQLAVTEASLSNPEADLNKGKQFIGRLGVNPLPGLRIGFSGAQSPYLSKADDQRLLEAGKGLGEFKQTVYGADLEASYRYLILFGEFSRSTWDATVTEKELSAWSFYIDAKYKVLPRVYLAVRYDRMDFSEIKNPDKGNKKEPWDYNVQRIEAGIGFRVTADATLKLVEQFTKFDGDISMIKLTAAQLSVPF